MKHTLNYTFNLSPVWIKAQTRNRDRCNERVKIKIPKATSKRSFAYELAEEAYHMLTGALIDTRVPNHKKGKTLCFADKTIIKATYDNDQPYLLVKTKSLFLKEKDAIITYWHVCKITEKATFKGFIRVSRFLKDCKIGYLHDELTDRTERRFIVPVSELSPPSEFSTLKLLKKYEES